MSRFNVNTPLAVSVGTGSTTVLPENQGRTEVTIVNDGANTVYLAFQQQRGTQPTATSGNGVRLNAGGGSWSSTAFLGAVSGIAPGGATNVTVMEF